MCCFRYHKGTDFQANHNCRKVPLSWRSVVLDTTKVLIFKQITTRPKGGSTSKRCFRYHKGTDFQANHNKNKKVDKSSNVVLDTTKVLIFKQITTIRRWFSRIKRCFRYHKGTDFQANHNLTKLLISFHRVVLDTTKVLIFKQITTNYGSFIRCCHVVLDTTKVLIFKQITTDLFTVDFVKKLF